MALSFFFNYSLQFVCNHSYLFPKGYFEGIVENLYLMPIYYPGWIMRVYYDLDDKDPILQVIFDKS